MASTGGGATRSINIKKRSPDVAGQEESTSGLRFLLPTTYYYYYYYYFYFMYCTQFVQVQVVVVAPPPVERRHTLLSPVYCA